MALVAFKVSVGASQGGNGGYRTLSNPAQTTSPLAAATTADTAAATVVTDLATVLTDYDAIGAAIVLISGDTYSATTHQFTENGSTGLTSAQLHTQMTSLNAMMTAFLAAQTAATTAKADTALAKSGSFDTSSDVTIVVNNANITRFPQFTSMLRAIEKIVVGSSLFTP